jgi:hypothetical protein
VADASHTLLPREAFSCGAHAFGCLTAFGIENFAQEDLAIWWNHLELSSKDSTSTLTVYENFEKYQRSHFVAKKFWLVTKVHENRLVAIVSPLCRSQDSDGGICTTLLVVEQAIRQRRWVLFPSPSVSFGSAGCSVPIAYSPS